MGETFNYKGKGKYAQKKQGFTRASGGKFDGMPNWGSVLKGGLGALGMMDTTTPNFADAKVKANYEKYPQVRANLKAKGTTYDAKTNTSTTRTPKKKGPLNSGWWAKQVKGHGGPS